VHYHRRGKIYPSFPRFPRAGRHPCLYLNSGFLPPFPTQYGDNHLLFGSVLLGVVTLIPIIHIPSVAENVFYQTVITWEWGLVVGASLVFILCAEFYKACIRPSVVRCVTGGRGGGREARGGGTRNGCLEWGKWFRFGVFRV